MIKAKFYLSSPLYQQCVTNCCLSVFPKNEGALEGEDSRDGDLVQCKQNTVCFFNSLPLLEPRNGERIVAKKEKHSGGKQD